MQLTEDTMVKVCDVEASYQALRAELATARGRRDTVLYAAWRETKDPKMAAAQLPRTITAATVRGAVLRIAPPADFTQLSLLDSDPAQN